MPFKVYIRQSIETDSDEIFIIEELFNNKRRVALPVKLEWQELSQHDSCQPTLKISGMIAQELYKALQLALEKQGTKPDSTSKVEGILEATKEHLKDLRRLVFEEKK